MSACVTGGGAKGNPPVLKPARYALVIDQFADVRAHQLTTFRKLMEGGAECPVGVSEQLPHEQRHQHTRRVDPAARSRTSR